MAKIQNLTRNDGALVNAYAQYNNAGNVIGNQTTGLGTARDKSTHGDVGSLPLLMRHDGHVLFRGSALIQKIIQLLPNDSTKKWGEVTLSEGDDKPDMTDYERRLNLRKTVAKAAIAGRLTGDGFIAIGIDDGLLWDQPVNELGIKSISWLKVLNRYDLQPEYGAGGYDDPEYYLFAMDRDRWPAEELPRRIHKSRLIRIAGVELPEDLLRDTCGYNDSILMSVFQSFRQYMSALGSSSSMLADYSVFVYGLSGLSDLLSSTDATEQAEAQKALLNRFLAIQMGMSTVKGLMLDSENESANFISRNYAGVNDIVGRLEDVLVACSGMPKSKLLGSANSGAFSEAGKSDRYEWADCISNYQHQYLTSAVKRLYELIFLAKDSPTRSVVPIGWDFEWSDTLQLTRLEQAQLQETYAKADAMAIRGRYLHPKEIRQSRFGQAAFGLNITIDDDLTEELTKEPEPPQLPPQQVPGQQQQPGKTIALATDEGKTQELPQRADADTLALLRKDALDGLIPMKLYWQAAGLDAEAVSNLMAEQREQSRAGYWEADY